MVCWTAVSLESFGEAMQQKPANELHRIEGHRAAMVFLSIVLPAKRHFPVLEGDEALIRDGDPMGVAGQILEDLGRSSERRFGIDHPVVGLDITKQPVPVPAFGQCFELPVKTEGPAAKGRSQGGQELPPPSRAATRSSVLAYTLLNLYSCRRSQTVQE